MPQGRRPSQGQQAGGPLAYLVWMEPRPALYVNRLRTIDQDLECTPARVDRIFPKRPPACG
jgi:hypothetical protein